MLSYVTGWMGKAVEFKKTMAILRTDIRKAYDSLEWHKVWEVLARVTPGHLLPVAKAILEAHMRGQASLFVGRHPVGAASGQRGIWQGATSSPISFGLIMHSILVEVCAAMAPAWAWARTQSPLGAAAWVDDVILLADGTSKLEIAAEILKDACAAFGLHCEWNAAKTVAIGTSDIAKKDMATALPEGISCAWKPDLILLGTALSFRDLSSGAAVRHRICQAWRARQSRRNCSCMVTWHLGIG